MERQQNALQGLSNPFGMARRECAKPEVITLIISHRRLRNRGNRNEELKRDRHGCNLEDEQDQRRHGACLNLQTHARSCKRGARG